MATYLMLDRPGHVVTGLATDTPTQCNLTKPDLLPAGALLHAAVLMLRASDKSAPEVIQCLITEARLLAKESGHEEVTVDWLGQAIQLLLHIQLDEADRPWPTTL
jgi:hypothetical protein